jgi:hypothetical protein
MTAWQRGGQGIQSHRIHSDDKGVLPREDALSRLVASWATGMPCASARVACAARNRNGHPRTDGCLPWGARLGAPGAVRPRRWDQ